jgi:hypothetical protein
MSDSIEFSARYRDWVVIKKASVHEDTKPEEVAFALASIRQTLDKKSFEFLGIDLCALDSYADSITNGKAKRYNDLAAAIQGLGSPEAKTAVEKSIGQKQELKEIANTYLLRRIMKGLKFDTDMNQEMLAKAYPHLKLPKPPGRRPKQ